MLEELLARDLGVLARVRASLCTNPTGEAFWP